MSILIPRLIHRVWLGGPMPPEFVAWGQSWARYHPGWTVKDWGEGDIDGLRAAPFLRRNMPRSISYSQRSNIYRYAVLAEHGGIYVDTDFECLKPLDPLIHEAKLFSAWEDNGSIANGFMGATAGHPVFAELMKEVDTLDLGQAKIAGPKLWTKAIIERCGDARVFERRLFYPYHWSEAAAVRKVVNHQFLNSRWTDRYPQAYAVHHWGSHWWKDSARKLIGKNQVAQISRRASS